MGVETRYMRASEFKVQTHLSKSLCSGLELSSGTTQGSVKLLHVALCSNSLSYKCKVHPTLTIHEAATCRNSFCLKEARVFPFTAARHHYMYRHESFNVIDQICG